MPGGGALDASAGVVVAGAADVALLAVGIIDLASTFTVL